MASVCFVEITLNVFNAQRRQLTVDVQDWTNTIRGQNTKDSLQHTLLSHSLVEFSKTKNEFGIKSANKQLLNGLP